MQNIHYAHRASARAKYWAEEAHGSRKALQLFFSFYWKPTAVKLLRVAQQTGSLKED